MRKYLAQISLWLVWATCVAAAGHASAQSSSSSSGDLMKPLLPLRLEGHGSLSWDGFAGFGLRAELPILQNGMLYNAHDEVSISLGSDFLLASFKGSNPLQIWPTVTVQWSLGVNEHFAFYPEIGLAAEIDRDGWQGVYPNVGFGGRYYLWRSVSIMGRFGWPMAISIGATF